MKTVKQTVILFLDEDRSNIPAHLIGQARLVDDHVIHLRIRGFGVLETWKDLFLTYTEAFKATDDFRKLLRYQKKMSGQLCKSKNLSPASQTPT